MRDDPEGAPDSSSQPRRKRLFGRRIGERREDHDEGALLSSRRFLPLFLVQALGAFNDNVFKNAFVALLTFRLSAELEMELSALVAIASGVFILPFALVSPFAGVIADRIDKAVMMRWVKALEILLMIAAAALYHSQNVLGLYVLLFLMGAQSAIFAPIKYGVLPQYLPREELVKGNGLIQAATFFAILIGTIAGANLILTEQGVLWVSIAVVVIAVIGWVASLLAPPAPPSGSDGQEAELWRAPWETLRVARATPVSFRAILAISWFWFVGATFLSLLPAFTKEQLGGDQTVFTLLLAAFSIGVGIGSVLAGRIYDAEVRVGQAPWGAIGIAVFAVDLWFAAGEAAVVGDVLRNYEDFLSTFTGWRVFVDFVGLAICAGLYLTPLNAVYQSAAPEAARGRVVACSNMLDAAFMAFSAAAIWALVASGWSAPEIMAVAGITGLIVAPIVARWDGATGIGAAVQRIWPVRGA